MFLSKIYYIKIKMDIYNELERDCGDNLEIDDLIYEEDKITLKSNYLFEDRMIVGLIYDKDENCLYANYNDFPEVMVISNI